jgi:hypothetical protein
MAVHFVGFRGEEYWSAVKVWGLPDFYHRGWDRRARREIMDGDTILFASGPHDQGTVEHNLPDLSKEYLDDPPDLAPESRF